MIQQIQRTQEVKFLQHFLDVGRKNEPENTLLRERQDIILLSNLIAFPKLRGDCCGKSDELQAYHTSRENQKRPTSVKGVPDCQHPCQDSFTMVLLTGTIEMLDT